MGWHNSHLHQFQIGKSRFGDPQYDRDSKNERKYALGDFGFAIGSKFEYEYDFGDGWSHKIEVEKLLDSAEFEASDIFITGRGACPPEDCGGPYGFMHLLQAIKSPRGTRAP